MIESTKTQELGSPAIVGRLAVERVVLDEAVDGLAVFGHLTAGGQVAGTMLLESGELAPTYGERSIGVVHSSLCIRGRRERFEITALDDMGRDLVDFLDLSIPGVQVTESEDDRIAGVAGAGADAAQLNDRLAGSGHAAVVRALLGLCGAGAGAAPFPLGLYGCYGYDFVRQVEVLPEAPVDVLDEPDYVLYLPTRLFVVDHVENSTTLIVAAPADGVDRADLQVHLARMAEATSLAGIDESPAVSVGEFSSDVDQDEYESNVACLQEAVRAGRIFQVVYGRMMSAEFTGAPLAVYRALRRTNPSPYLFYLCDADGVLLGASPEMAVRVGLDRDRRVVELKPIAGTAPRGVVDGHIDEALDERYEIALKVDRKELAEHAMLVDLARNDIAAISRPGTTRVIESFAIEKYSRVQHLVSRVQGVLQDDCDALDAYLATMNMGTLTGAPKPEAMRLIAETEATARGLFGGGIGFVTATGELETAIVIRSMRIKGGQVHIRAGAGIVADSDPHAEWLETGYKAQACIDALKESGHASRVDHR